jgi:hypothetical protein
MRWPFITRAAHERILRACEDAALERLEADRAQLERAHADALDRYRGRMRPAAREAADEREAKVRNLAAGFERYCADRREVEAAAMIAAKRTPMGTGVDPEAPRWWVRVNEATGTMVECHCGRSVPCRVEPR